MLVDLGFEVFEIGVSLVHIEPRILVPGLAAMGDDSDVEARRIEFNPHRVFVREDDQASQAIEVEG